MDAITRFHNTKSASGDPRDRVLASDGLLRRFVNVCNAEGQFRAQERPLRPREDEDESRVERLEAPPKGVTQRISCRPPRRPAGYASAWM
jgi:hypothetical protein